MRRDLLKALREHSLMTWRFGWWFTPVGIEVFRQSIAESLEEITAKGGEALESINYSDSISERTKPKMYG